MKKIKTYSDLISLDTFDDRFEYLKTNSTIGDDSFGFDRYLNQNFYNSREWRNLRNKIILRDRGCDLACKDHEILDDEIIIHHLNPITKEDIINRTDKLLNPEYLITTTQATHNAIHYGDITLINRKDPIVRNKNDTCPWKH